MPNGLTSQLTNSVTSKPRGRLPTFTSAAKSIRIIIGTIISQMSSAIGALIWLPEPNSRPRSRAVNPGTSRPRATPATMHRPTHTLR